MSYARSIGDDCPCECAFSVDADDLGQECSGERGLMVAGDLEGEYCDVVADLAGHSSRVYQHPSGCAVGKHVPRRDVAVTELGRGVACQVF